MNNFQPFGKIMIAVGVIIIIFGIILTFSSRIPFLGKLPGDIFIRKDNFSFYFPVVTCIIISVVISLVLYLVQRFK